MTDAQTVICTFRVKTDHLGPFQDLLNRHWPLLRALELVTETAEQLFIDPSEEGPTVISIFEWASHEAVSKAHHHPDVTEIWEAMDPMCEARDGRPAMEFPHFQPLHTKR